MRRLYVGSKRWWRRTDLRHGLMRYDGAIRFLAFWTGLFAVAYTSFFHREFWSVEILPWQINSALLGITALSALFAARVSYEVGRRSLVKPLIWVAISLILVSYSVFDYQFPPLTPGWLLFYGGLSWLFIRLASKVAHKISPGSSTRTSWPRPTISAWEMLERRGMPPLAEEWRELLEEAKKEIGDMALAVKLKRGKI